jgi:hypothetical protein
VTNEAAGQLTSAHNPAIFTGTVTNYGTIKNTDTTITWPAPSPMPGLRSATPGTNS